MHKKILKKCLYIIIQENIRNGRKLYDIIGNMTKTCIPRKGRNRMSAMTFIFGLVIMLAVLAGANSYIALRIYQGVKFVIPQTGAKLFLIIGILVLIKSIIGFTRSMLPVPAIIKNILGVINSYWMGIFLCLLFYFAVADIVLLFLKIAGVISKPMRQGVYFASGLTVIILTMITVGYGIYNANQVKQVSYNIRLEKKALASELNLVLISDLHLGAVNSEKRLEKVVQRINNLEPDLVCIAGDIFDNDFYAIHNPDKAIHLLKSIKAQYGVYACLGNHDGGRTLNKMLDFLERSNIKVLIDEYVAIDERFILAGRLDPSPIGRFGDMRRKKPAEVLSGIDVKLPVIVIDHNPANIDEYGSEVDLVLCGHTHRGQIFPGNLFTRAMYVVDYGYYRKDESSPHVVVTSGAGTWGMPMRVGTNCEVVSIKLH